MLDCKAAFTSCSTVKLKESMFSLGIIPPLLDWIDQLLSVRVSAVHVNGAVSEPYDVLSGGVQGSSISCLAFLCFLAPILEGVKQFPNVACHAYADDLKLSSSCPTELQRALDYVVRELDRRQLSLSLHKCLCIRFLPARSNATALPHPPAITIHGIQLAFADAGKATRDLGVLIDDRLSFEHHARHVANRSRLLCSQILRCLRLRDPSHLTKAYTTFVLPVIDYCSPLYASASKKSLDVIERVQRWFSKRVFRVCGIRMCSYSERLARLSLAPVRDRLVANDVIFAHSVFHERHSCRTLVPVPVNPRYPLIHNMRLKIERRRRGIRANCPANRIPARWNALPTKVLSLKKIAFVRNVRPRREYDLPT